MFSAKDFQCPNSENEAIWAESGQAEEKRGTRIMGLRQDRALEYGKVCPNVGG